MATIQGAAFNQVWYSNMRSIHLISEVGLLSLLLMYSGGIGNDLVVWDFKEQRQVTWLPRCPYFRVCFIKDSTPLCYHYHHSNYPTRDL